MKNFLQSMTRRWQKLMIGGKRTALARIFIRCLIVFVLIGTITELLDLHMFGKARAIIQRIAIGIGALLSLSMLLALSSEKEYFHFPDEEGNKLRDRDKS